MSSTRRRISWLLALAAALLAGAWLWQRPPEPAGAATTEAGPHRSPAPRGRVLAAPVPEARGTLSIRGRVLGADGPVAQAAVVATAGGDNLSRRRGGCPKGEGLLEDGCPEALRRLAELADSRGGEALAVARTVSKPDGSFELTGLVPGPVTLWAEAAGRGIAVRPNVAPGADGVELRLEAGRVLEGRVVGDRGEPLAGASVTALGPEHRRYFDGQSGEDGRFRIGPVPEGRYVLVATFDGRTPARALADPRAPPTLQLFTTLRLSGRVMRDGRPVPGAAVEARTEDGPAGTATSGEDGRFELGPLGPDTYTVIASADLGHGVETVRLTPGGRADVQIDLVGVAEVTGVVLDEQQRPVEGADVSIDDGRLLEVHTGADGRYRMVLLEPGGYELTVKAYGYLNPEPAQLRLVTGQRAVADFHLETGVALRGVVVGPDGRPVARAAIDVLQSVMSHHGRLYLRRGHGETDAEGAFEVAGLTPDEYRLSVRHPQFRPLNVQLQAPGPEAHLVMERGGAIEGQVVDEQGRPVKDVSVMPEPLALADDPVPDRASIVGLRDTTDAEGRFLLGGLDPGTYIVHASLFGAVRRRSTARVEVRAGAPASVQIRFKASGRIAGRVVGPGGAVLSGVVVQATQRSPEGAETFSAFDLAGIGPDGQFEIYDLPPGRYVLEAKLEGHRMVLGPGGLPEAETDSAPVTLMLMPAPMYRGRVLREDGRPVTAFFIDGESTADPEGKFELEPRYYDAPECTISAPGFAPQRVTLSRDRPVEVVLRPGHPVTGQVVDARTGLPVPDASVALQVDEDLETMGDSLGSRTLTDPAGGFVLPHVEQALAIVVTKDGFAPARYPLRATETAVSIRLSPSDPAP